MKHVSPKYACNCIVHIRCTFSNTSHARFYNCVFLSHKSQIFIIMLSPKGRVGFDLAIAFVLWFHLTWLLIEGPLRFVKACSNLSLLILQERHASR